MTIETAKLFEEKLKADGISFQIIGITGLIEPILDSITPIGDGFIRLQFHFKNRPNQIEELIVHETRLAIVSNRLKKAYS